MSGLTASQGAATLTCGDCQSSEAAREQVRLADGHAVRAQETTLSLTVTNGRFEPAELQAPANKPFVIAIKNSDSKPVEFESSSLRVEKVIPGKAQAKVRVRALSSGRYEFFDDFNKSNRGAIVVP